MRETKLHEPEEPKHELRPIQYAYGTVLVSCTSLSRCSDLLKQENQGFLPAS
jgi:hypothetical protein